MLVETPHAIIGTAGHIDHGKTALVKALTGMNVDTLAEEKQRGITIELGFAFMEDPRLKKEIIFIDVPGHEKLIKTMVAGASNLDAALLVVAADEGVNVQTLEHFDILKLLEIPGGAIALTKCDLADSAAIARVTNDIKSLAHGTFLDGAPIIPVSSITGQGIDELKTALVQAANNSRKRSDSGTFRMPIDRTFTMHGFGTVIAGTILSGEVKVGDKLEVLPEGIQARVRGIQVHAKNVDKAIIGTRTAINLQDVKKEELRRGQCIAAVGSLQPTSRIDARLHLLKSYGEGLKNRTRVRLHIGTDEVMCRLVLLAGDLMHPGNTEPVQFILESPTTALPKDRFVIRTFSSMQTIGGGVILDAQPPKHKRFDEDTIDALDKLGGDIEDSIEHFFEKSGVTPIGLAETAASIGESEEAVARIMDEFAANGKITRIQPRKQDGERDIRKETYIHSKHYADLEDKLANIISDYYSRNPYRTHMPLADLQSRFTKLAPRPVYEALVTNMLRQKKLRLKETRIGLADRKINWKQGEEQLAAKIENIYLRGRYATPPEEDVIADLRVKPDMFRNVMAALIDEGRLVRLAERVIYHEDYYKSAKEFVINYIKENGGITAAEMRDKLGATRKYTIAVLEYLDTAQVTKRLGDKRVLK